MVILTYFLKYIQLQVNRYSNHYMATKRQRLTSIQLHTKKQDLLVVQICPTFPVIDSFCVCA